MIWRCERPGVLTLHDMVLHHFLIDRTVKVGDFDAYRRQLLEDHGWVGEAAAMPMRWPGRLWHGGAVCVAGPSDPDQPPVGNLDP